MEIHAVEIQCAENRSMTGTAKELIQMFGLNAGMD